MLYDMLLRADALRCRRYAPPYAGRQEAENENSGGAVDY